VQPRGIDERIKIIKKALHLTPKASPQLMKQAENIENQLREILRALNGDRSISKRNENQPPSISSRISRLMYGYMRSTAEPTQTMKDQYRITGEELEPQLEKLRQLVEKDLKKLEAEMEAVGAPWTPGRIPVWKK
jgi:predicted ATP-grasp superfamily ATP-dependent carboligase